MQKLQIIGIQFGQVKKWLKLVCKSESINTKFYISFFDYKIIILNSKHTQNQWVFCSKNSSTQNAFLTSNKYYCIYLPNQF